MPATASPPGSRRPTGPGRSGCWPTRRPEPYDLVQPGHVFPLRGARGRRTVRPGHTEASVDLARLAGLTPAGGDLRAGQRRRHDEARCRSCETFADEHGLALVSIEDLIRYRRRTEAQVAAGRDDHAADPVRRLRRPRLPRTRSTGRSSSRWSAATSATARRLVRLHSECLTGDVFGSLRCDCGPQLDEAMRQVAAEGRASWSTCAGTRAAGSGCCTSCRRTSCRTPAATRSTRTSTSGCPPTPATTAPARRSWPTWASRRCGC